MSSTGISVALVQSAWLASFAGGESPVFDTILFSPIPSGGGRGSLMNGDETMDEGLPVLTLPRDEVIPLLPILFTYSKMIAFHILAQFVDDHGCLTHGQVWVLTENSKV